ncbi:hypothetical protein BD309DRAFT_870656 [Dichomitus squalens]|uniref:Fungal-type protein kinase domain-containing protein n=2 Tax=Dichomitus squalens TaxID=114155 RepID=A0A4V6MVR1_9APHY|nr:uncharacterized protein DICSQDRAFT_174923 [Dichomitus squalens LYAD-421 SS1]EJF56406.1 hypothetical protein DICSQDRAFT_174923 [Dichomitus squalens LYAD-421 SS1]TBU21603.1 hypothetical protein BD311DRAFT_782825 [Dichomitus squalens]TBU40232.1 hypothetical protein BD309DRAFT_870656 [Dichomitus squalens]TBU56977.1 hypothetical protein BD310DRAFT_822504 [Dichomitus squalens]
MSEREISERLIEAARDCRICHSCFLAPAERRLGFRDEPTGQNRTMGLFREPQEGSQLFADQLVSVEIHHAGIDPFNAGDGERCDAQTKRARSRLYDHISTIAEDLFVVQQRVFLFMILITGRKYRIIRWDRAGTVVTPSVDYYEQPAAFCEIISRFSQLSDTALGFDASATRIFPHDIDSLRMDVAALADTSDIDHSERELKDGDPGNSFTFAYVRSLFRASLSSDWPRFKLCVPDGDQAREYLVGKPTFCDTELFGRGTRGYVALDRKTNRFVWLKDAWRASHRIAEREGDVLARLNDARVKNVPTLLCHGDIDDQVTITADWWERKYALSPALSPSPSSSLSPPSPTLIGSQTSSSKKRKRVDESPPVSEHGEVIPKRTAHTDGPLRQHRHYRIAVVEVCMPLKNFQYGQQLVTVVLDCMKAHHQAATRQKTRILHRDISTGNILIYPRVVRLEGRANPWMMWTGMLTDWELSKPIDAQEASSRATQMGRMGTYQFMSVNLLKHLTKPVEISDELESFFHVLLHHSVRYLRSNCESTSGFIQNYFERYSSSGEFTCGQKSITLEHTGVLRNQQPYGPLVFFSPMDDILATMLKCFHAHYKVLNYEARKAAPPSPPPTLPTSGAPDNDSEEDDDDLVPPFPLVSIGYPHGDITIYGDTPLDDVPTTKEFQRAKRITRHKFLLEYLAKMRLDSRWWIGDRIPSPSATSADELPVSTSPSRTVPTSTSTSNKRRRLASPGCVVSIPARLHETTRRARATPRTLPARRRS